MARWSKPGGLPPPVDWLEKEIGSAIAVERPEILSRASGLGRSGLVAQLTASRLATRLALGIEVPLAHAVVDRLLGFDRPLAESRLQLTPVEWGVWTFLILRALESLDRAAMADPRNSALAAQTSGIVHLSLDRVGPDPFDPAGLGPIVTVRWPVRVGTVAGAARLWLPESVVNHWLAVSLEPASSQPGSADLPETLDPAMGTLRRAQTGALASCWRAEAGFVTMSQGLKRLRQGGILPLADSRLKGTPASPIGPVDLILDLDGRGARFRIPARPVDDSSGRLVRVEAIPLCEPRPRNPIVVANSEDKPMTQPRGSSTPPSTGPAASPLDVPVTLTVELGRVNLTLTQLADLKPGDVVELNRHSRAPVELTSNGRLVARGELILIDTELGVRVTNVFL